MALIADRVLANVDDVEEAQFFLLRSSRAEELFAQYALDIELSPYQTLFLKLMRGRFRTAQDVWDFIEEYDLHWIRDTGNIRLAERPDGTLYPNNQILLPGSYGKTTIIQVDLTMEACENPNSRTQLIFKNMTEAHACSGAVRINLENPKLVEVFGNFVPNNRSWSNDRFSVAQRTWPDIRDNFEFYSTNSDAALGKRSDRVISDDCETPDTARTADACAKLVEWFSTGPMTSPKPLWAKDRRGNALVPPQINWPDRLYWGHSNLGTIFHPRGLHAFCAENPTYNYLRFDCYKDRKQTISLDERMMSVEELHAKRQSLGVLTFNKRYRNIAIDPADQSFQESWLRGGEHLAESGKRVTYPGCLDHERGYGEVDPKWKLYLGFDPATGSHTRFAAYSAFVVVGQDPLDDDPDTYLIDFLKIQTEYSRMLDYLLDGNAQYGIEGFMSKYDLARITLEKNNHGMFFTGEDRMQPYIRSGLVSPSYTGAQKLDPEIGIPALAPMVERGKLRLPYRDAGDKNRTEQFIVDMVEFHPIRDKRDLVMALWLGTIPLRGPRSQYRSWYRTGGGRMYKNPAYRR